MQASGLGWLGIRSTEHEAISALLSTVLGLGPQRPEEGMTVFDLADGSQVEVFDTAYPGKEHLVTGPVPGFWVDDLPAATAELVRHGVPLLGRPGPSWQHFRAPGGLVLELKAR